MDVPTLDELLFISDAAINIAPDLITKVDIVQNAIDLAQLAAAWKSRAPAFSRRWRPSTPTIQSSTIDAALLSKMAERGQITGGIVDGPLAMDNAIDRGGAHQGHRDRRLVAGHANILVVPDLESRQHAGQAAHLRAVMPKPPASCSARGAGDPDQPRRQFATCRAWPRLCAGGAVEYKRATRERRNRRPGSRPLQSTGVSSEAMARCTCITRPQRRLLLASSSRSVPRRRGDVAASDCHRAGRGPRHRPAASRSKDAAARQPEDRSARAGDAHDAAHEPRRWATDHHRLLAARLPGGH